MVAYPWLYFFAKYFNLDRAVFQSNWVTAGAASGYGGQAAPGFRPVGEIIWVKQTKTGKPWFGIGVVRHRSDGPGHHLGSYWD